MKRARELRLREAIRLIDPKADYRTSAVTPAIVVLIARDEDYFYVQTEENGKWIRLRHEDYGKTWV